MTEFVGKAQYAREVTEMKGDIEQIKADLSDLKDKELPGIKKALTEIDRKLFRSNGNKSMVEIQHDHDREIKNLHTRLESIENFIRRTNEGFYNWTWRMLVKITVLIVFMVLGYVVGIRTGILEHILKILEHL